MPPWSPLRAIALVCLRYAHATPALRRCCIAEPVDGAEQVAETPRPAMMLPPSSSHERRRERCRHATLRRWIACHQIRDAILRDRRALPHHRFVTIRCFIYAMAYGAHCFSPRHILHVSAAYHYFICRHATRLPLLRFIFSPRICHVAA